MKRICITERDENGREIMRRYSWYDPTDNPRYEDENYETPFTEWLGNECYDLKWRYEECNEQLENFNVNRYEAWLEDVDLKGCIKANFQLL